MHCTICGVVNTKRWHYRDEVTVVCQACNRLELLEIKREARLINKEARYEQW